MMNFQISIIACFFFTLPAFSQEQVQAQRDKSLPNIIYIYADDLGYGETGPYGQTKIKTPHLDQMAKEGMRFTQHYTSTPVCAPARCMLLTGKHGGHSYIRGNYELGGFPDSAERGQLPLRSGEFTIADLLKQKGYTTAIIGKWGLGMANSEGSPLQHGFDYFYGYLDQKQAHNYYPTHLWENDKWDSLHQPFINVHQNVSPANFKDEEFSKFKGNVYAPDKLTKNAINFIQKNKQNRFFLYLPYTIPHVSLQVPDEWVKQYVGQFHENPYYGENGYAPSKYPLSTYAGMISYLDAQIGKILDAIKKEELDNNTIIMFSSDNGPTFNGGVNASFFNSTAGLRGLKMDVYEGGIREPFIVRWPGKIKAGTISNHISVQYDVMATLAELTQQKIPETDGISFLPELLGKKNNQRQHKYIYFEYPEKGGQLAIRMKNWKGIKTDLRKNKDAPWQLYDLGKDRQEKNNMADQHPEIIKAFDTIVQKEHKEPVIKKWAFLTNFQ